MRKLIIFAAAALIALPVTAASAQDAMADHKMEAGKMADDKMAADHKMSADNHKKMMADDKMAGDKKMAPKHKAMHKKHHAKKPMAK